MGSRKAGSRIIGPEWRWTEFDTHQAPRNEADKAYSISSCICTVLLCTYKWYLTAWSDIPVLVLFLHHPKNAGPRAELVSYVVWAFS